MPKTVDCYVEGLTQGHLDPTEIETDVLQDLVFCLEARQRPVDVDGCLYLMAASINALAAYKRPTGTMK